MTFTGICERRSENLPLSEKAFMTLPFSIHLRIFGAIPPARYIPPVVIPLRARFPASAPYIDTKMSSAFLHSVFLPFMASSAITAGFSLSGVCSASAASGSCSFARRNSYIRTSPGPERSLSTLTCPRSLRTWRHNSASNKFVGAKPACPPSVEMG